MSVHAEVFVHRLCDCACVSVSAIERLDTVRKHDTIKNTHVPHSPQPPTTAENSQLSTFPTAVKSYRAATIHSIFGLRCLFSRTRCDLYLPRRLMKGIHKQVEIYLHKTVPKVISVETWTRNVDFFFHFFFFLSFFLSFLFFSFFFFFFFFSFFLSFFLYLNLTHSRR